MSTDESVTRADAVLARRLERLDGGRPRSAPVEVSQRRADELLARVAWSRLAEPGDRTAGELLALLGAPSALRLLVSGARPREVLAAATAEHPGHELTPQAVAAGLKRWLPRLDRAATVADVDRGAEAGMRVILPSDELWPTALDDLGAHAPLCLWVRGDARLLGTTSLSVVGARAATGYGAHVTAELVAGVCPTGTPIVSGAAYGVDATAHRTALSLEAPTVAVLAGGVDRPYPRAHDRLLARIVASGAVCGEMPPGAAPTRWRFLMRNRLIAAFSAGTLVTEAGLRSGSLNTAGHAAELGRAIGAVPGPVTSAASAGCHRLVRDYGATLVTDAGEALELLGLGSPALPVDEAADSADEGPTRQPATHRRLLDALPLRGARTLDDAAARAGLGRAEARDAMAELEVLGFVAARETPGDAEVRWALLRRE